jgi:uncharacterized protein YndB with AHSA1/START domain
MAQDPITVAREASIDASAERIWNFVSDPELMSRWFALAERMEILEGEGLGRRQRMYAKSRGRDSEADQVVTRWEPPLLIAWRQEAERVDGKPTPRYATETRFSIELDPEGASTMVRLRGDQVPSSFMRGLAIRRFGVRQAMRLMEDSLVRLAILAEAGQTGPNPTARRGG